MIIGKKPKNLRNLNYLLCYLIITPGPNKSEYWQEFIHVTLALVFGTKLSIADLGDSCKLSSNLSLLKCFLRVLKNFLLFGPRGE